jgi:two-component system, OmpR family, response regulator ResD
VTGDTARLLQILVVDDDRTVADVVITYLERAGYQTRHAVDGPDALRQAASALPDLVILDLMLPGLDGLEVCRRLRTLGSVPVIMLTALDHEDDRVLGLEVGADDYVSKPFSPRELVLRVGSVLRRSSPVTSAPVTSKGAEILRLGAGIGLVEVDVTGHRATRAGAPLSLTGREFELLVFLLRHPGEAFDRADLMRQVWGWSYGDHSTVTVHVRRLREKIEDDPAHPRFIVTVWGVGYRLENPTDAVHPC